MTRAQITTLKERRASLFQDQKRISEKAEGENRSLSAEESQQYERLGSDFDSLTERIDRAEREAGFAPEQQRRAPEADVEIEERAPGLKPGELPKGDEYRDAFAMLVRSSGDRERLNAEQRAALAVGVDANGGYLVPDEFARVLFESAEEFSVIRQYATVITTGENGDLIIPRRSGRSTAVWLSEGAAYTESEPDFGVSVLKNNKVGLYSKASDEMIDDPFFDVLAFLAKQAGEAIGITSNAAYVAGAANATDRPKGIVNRSTVGVTLAAGQTTTIASADSLIDLQHSIVGPYRGDAVWMMHDQTLKGLRKLKTTSGEYIWEPSIKVGVPDALLGRPVLIDPNMPTPAASAKTVVFGSLRGYYIRDVQELRIKPLNELFALNGQVGIRASARTDGDLVDTAAVRVLQQAAA